jgi:hypothetical protein
MIRFLVVIYDSFQEMPGINPGPLGWHISGLNTEIVEVKVRNDMVIKKMLCEREISASLLKTNLWFSWLTLQKT